MRVLIYSLCALYELTISQMNIKTGTTNIITSCSTFTQYVLLMQTWEGKKKQKSTKPTFNFNSWFAQL